MHILILGGTTPGLRAAAAFRSQGHRVTLAVSSSFLGEDLCGTSRFLPAMGQEAGLTLINKTLAELGAPELEGPLLWGKAKKALVRAAMAQSVAILYMTRLAGVELADGRVCAAHLAGKQGLTRIPCDALVDATLYAEPTRQLAGQPGRVQRGAAIGTYLEYRGLPGAAAHARLPFGEWMAGCVAEDHAYLRVSLTAPHDLSIPEARRLVTLRSLETAQAFHAAFPEARLQQVLDPFADLTLSAPPAAGVDGFYRADALIPAQLLSLDSAPERGELRLLSRPQAAQDAQLLVAGGGTAGVWAAVSAAREGMHVCMVEMFSQLGGTRTLGGIFPLYGG
ncbi:MAG TPA: FAD-dependent oxidoreductase, partial [Clostridia bacterium]|nr:FAD-dependent oxidoreductase [Clostridia bacterium]